MFFEYKEEGEKIKTLRCRKLLSRQMQLVARKHPDNSSVP
jgi:hypothetical protein